MTFERAATLGNILTFTFVVWIVNRFEQIPLQNSRKALKANEHSLGDINRVNIATSDGFLLFTRLLKALPYNSMTSNEMPTHIGLKCNKAIPLKLHIFAVVGHKVELQVKYQN